MFNIGDFLVKFKQLTPPDKEIKEVFCETVFNIIKIKINKNNIDVKNKTIFINENSFVKNEIFLHQNKILEYMKNRLGKNSPKKIL